MKGKDILATLAASSLLTGCMGPTLFAIRSVVNYERQEATMEGAITNQPENSSSVEADKQYETAASVNTSTGTSNMDFGVKRPAKDEKTPKSAEK
jgi:hypothetical protein